MTYDEFSALFRTRYDTFSELIDKGVKIDAHPAGIQVLEYFWVKLFGENSALLKLPFLLFGIGFVYFSWKLAKSWCGIEVANYFAAFLTVSEFYIMYSQIARPYISGAFFTMAMAYYWSKMIICQKINIKHSIAYVLFGTLSLYNHYFSLLLAGLIGLTGLLLFNKKLVFRYIAINLIVLFLFLPHISLFFHQLSHEGLGWLGKPNLDFLLEFAGYLFHYSWVYTILIFTIGILGYFQQRKHGNQLKKKLIVSGTIWFIISFSFAFLYSIFHQPIIQFSTLIFSVPFVFLALFCKFKSRKIWIHSLLVLLILSIGFFTLIRKRKYYELFYNESHLQTLHDALKAQDKFGEERISILLRNHPPIVEFYMKNNPGFNKLNVMYTHQTSKKELINTLSGNEKPYFAYGIAKDLEYTFSKIIRDYYPYKISQNNYYIGSFKVFSKVPADSILAINDTITYTTNRFHVTMNGWNIKDSTRVCKDSKGRTVGYLMDSRIDYGPSVTIPFNKAIYSSNTIITAKAIIYSKNTYMINPILVVSMKDTIKNELLIWKGINSNEYKNNDTLYTMYNSFRIGNVKEHENVVIDCYIWNREKDSFYIKQITFSSWYGNPYTYGIYQPISSSTRF